MVFLNKNNVILCDIISVQAYLKRIVWYHGNVFPGTESKFYNGCYENSIPPIKTFECSPMILV